MGRKGGIHTMCLLWAQNSQEEDWGFLLIGALNSFNEDNRMEILWDVRHEWTSGAQFTPNCYRHWATLVVQELEDGSGHFLNIK